MSGQAQLIPAEWLFHLTIVQRTSFPACCLRQLLFITTLLIRLEIHMSYKPARILTFKCPQCGKSMQVFLQKVSACSHIQPYQGICQCGYFMRHATGQKDAVADYLAAPDGQWTHHH